MVSGLNSISCKGKRRIKSLKLAVSVGNVYILSVGHSPKFNSSHYQLIAVVWSHQEIPLSWVTFKYSNLSEPALWLVRPSHVTQHRSLVGWKSLMIVRVYARESFEPGKCVVKISIEIPRAFTLHTNNWGPTDSHQLRGEIIAIERLANCLQIMPDIFEDGLLRIKMYKSYFNGT